MNLTRRNFLAWAGLSAVGAVACEVGIREGELNIQSPVQLPEDLVKGRDNWYATLCRNCPSSEGVIVRVMEGRAKKIQGNPDYPINLGKQSARCEGGLQALYHPDRLTGPMRRIGPRGSADSFEPTGWTPALDRLRRELEARGDGLLLITEPLRGHLGMVVDRFANAMKGRHLGFEAIDNITYRAAVKNVFGQDLLPDFNLEQTNFLLSFGADFLSTWVSPTRWNRGYGEFRQGPDRSRRGTLVQVGSRFSMTAANADMWVPLPPGWEGHLAMGLAYAILETGREAPGVDVGALTGGRGREAFLEEELRDFRPEAVASRIEASVGKLELPENLGAASLADFIRKLAGDFAGNRPSLAIGGDEAAAHSNGLFNLEAIYALNYLVGSVGAPGGIKFNPSSPLPDRPAVAKVGSMGDWRGISNELAGGDIRLLLVHQANPVHGLPGSMRFREAMDRDDLFIVSFSPFIDDTTVMADLILPDRVYLEDWGDDIPDPGPGFQVLGMQQPVVNPLSDLDPRSFPNILLTMAQELGKDAELPWDSVEEVLREGADQLFELKRGSIQAASRDEFWTALLRQGGWWDEGETGPTTVDVPSLGNIVARARAAKALEPAFPGFALASDTFYLMPFSHNTLLDGRGAHLPWLQGTPDPLTTIAWQTWVEMNDRKAKDLGLKEGDIVEVISSRDSIRALVYPTPAMPPDVVGVPLGQGHINGPDYATERGEKESSNVMKILEPTQVEHTGALAWASTRVRIRRTGDSVKVSKFEGIVPAREIGITAGERIIKTVTPGDG